jgi:hypothetical protein
MFRLTVKMELPNHDEVRFTRNRIQNYLQTIGVEIVSFDTEQDPHTPSTDMPSRSEFIKARLNQFTGQDIDLGELAERMSKEEYRDFIKEFTSSLRKNMPLEKKDFIEQKEMEL